jgi:hypothetical protein
VTDTSSRLARRVQHDFPKPAAGQHVLQLLTQLPHRAGYEPEVFTSERVQAALIVLANGDIRRLYQAVGLAMRDWRDLLVAAGLANEDWPDRLDHELGPISSGPGTEAAT